jgi:DNA repair exonuclease SbcCD ATPase subunit
MTKWIIEMLRFNYIEYKNLNSVGNHPIKIDLDRHPTTLIGGQNGAGKSTMGNAIAYCLFGKFLNGIKLAQAINSINKKNLLTKCSFTKNGEDWLVIRGEKPKKFEIYRNDELLDQYANARDQQTFLEIILGMDFKVFTQLVIINKERYVPFMEMSAADRRKIVEDLLDISIFTEMNEVVKQEIVRLKREEATIDKEIAVDRAKLEGQQNLIKQTQASIQESTQNTQSEIDELDQQLKQSELRELEVLNQIQDISVQGHDKIKKQKKEFEQLASEFETKIKSEQKLISFFEKNDVCPTCSQDINSDLINQKITEAKNNIADTENTVSELLSVYEQIVNQDKEFETRSKNLQELNFELRQIQQTNKSLNDQKNKLLRKAQNTPESDLLDEHMNLYNEMESVLETKIDTLRSIIEQRDMYEDLRALLKDDGIKAMIIKEYNALMNRKINEYLNAMNFYVNMTIDENFKESFHAMHKENFSYENLSTGQKTRVNLAIFLALMEIASIKNSVVTNICFFDELLENLDAEGVKDVLVLLKEKLYDKSVFVVTQRFEEFQDLFHSTIKFKLNNSGFTEFSN